MSEEPSCPSLRTGVFVAARQLEAENPQWRWTTRVPVSELLDAIDATLDDKQRCKGLAAVQKRHGQRHLGGSYSRAPLAKLGARRA